MSAGKDLDIRAGAPIQTERVEGGLLSYLSDITADMTPFEAGLGHFCHMWIAQQVAWRWTRCVKKRNRCGR